MLTLIIVFVLVIFFIADLIQTNLVFTFVLTNEDIYVGYEISPFGKVEFGGPGPDYNACGNLVPIRKRDVCDPIGDFVKLAIGYNYAENIVRWLINDQEVYRINRLGFPIERKYRNGNDNVPGELNPPSKLGRPTQLVFGIVNGNGMAEHNAQNPSNLSNPGLVDLSLGGYFPSSDPNVTNVDGTNRPNTYLAYYNQPPMNGTNFGQGNNVSYKYFSVYLSADKKEVGVLPGLHCCKEKVLLSVCEQDTISGVNASNNVSKYKCKGCVTNYNPCSGKCSCYSSSATGSS